MNRDKAGIASTADWMRRPAQAHHQEDFSQRLASIGNSRETVGYAEPLRSFRGAAMRTARPGTRMSSSNKCLTPTYMRDNVTAHVQEQGRGRALIQRDAEVRAGVRHPPASDP